MNLKKFFSELERRKVYKVTIAYGIAAWVLAQIAGLISASFEAQPWVMQMIITILIIGFPVALTLSWIFDFGPKGIERTEYIDGALLNENEPISVKLVIGMLVFIIIMVMAGRWSFQQFGKVKKETINSIAILPFDNFTGNDSLAYFVSGMQASLIGDMQKIGALRVPSKTSSNSFKDVALSIPEIAKELNVDAAIEGSITCMGEDSICVQIRLIRAFPEEEQLWVQDYRIEKRQILNFYNKVTKQISKEIDIALTPQEDLLLAEARLVKPEAYEAYLKGLYYWEKLDEQSVNKALKYFQLAADLDPEWAEPYAGLANAWGVFSFFGYLPKSVTLPKVYPYLNKALEIDPNSAKAHYVAAILAVWSEWDWEKGEKEFLRSIQLDPNDALTRMYYAHLLMILRRLDEANEQGKIGLELDPMKPLVLSLYGVLVWGTENDISAATRAFEKSLSIDSNFVFAMVNLLEIEMEIALKKGEHEKWIEFWNKKVSTSGDWNEKGREAVLQAFHENGFIASIEEMFRMNEIYGNECYMTGYLKAERYMILGNVDKAMESLEKDLKEMETMMPYISPKYPYYEQFKDNPRYIEILKKMNLPTE
ncbi:MAG: hypothetical protein WBN28_09160 [Lutimonas sp.]